MPGTRRLPLHRKQTKPLVSDLAIDLFEQMRGLPCTCTPEVLARFNSHRKGEGCPGCVKWWELRPNLRRTLGGRVWEEFYIISRHPPDRRRNWPADSGEGRFLMLEQASEARRRARAAMSPPTTPAVSEPEQWRQKRGPPKSGNGAPDAPVSSGA
jgi:hypothetical protein